MLSWIFLIDPPYLYDPTAQYGIFGFNSWRVIFAFPAVTCIMRLIAFTVFYRYDLPQEYLARGKKEEAQEELLKTYHPEFLWGII